MLFIAFKAGNADYALEANKVVAVVPFVTLQACPGAPAYIAGMANYRGTSVPVINLVRLVGGTDCAAFLSTRIVLTEYTGQNNRRRLIGLLAETVTNTVERAESDFNQNNVAMPGSPYPGKLAVSGTGFIQRIEVARLMPSELEQMLFAEPEKSVS